MFKKREGVSITSETSSKIMTAEDRAEARAVAAEPAAVARGVELLAEFRAKHRADKAAWRFDCRRHGDFLAVFIDRLRRVDCTTKELQLQPVCAAISLGKSGFRLIKGHGPDRRGTLLYWADRDGDGCHPQFPQHTDHQETLHLLTAVALEKNTSGFGNVSFGYGPRYTRHKTEGFPRPAEDDQIIFEGAVLRCPAGTGQATYDAILAAISAGSRRPRR